MDQLSELRAAVQSDLTLGDESSFIDAPVVDLAINRAYRKIGAMFKWKETRDALKTSSIANHEYYAYPRNWRPDSIWKLTLDGVDFQDPLAFEDYEFEKDNSIPSGLEKMWANNGKQYHIYPTPTADGDKNIKIWGYKFVDKLVLDGDITIFSYSLPEINEAIVLEAGAILKNKGDIQEGVKTGLVLGSQLLSQPARGIVLSTWTKISQEQQKLIKTVTQFNTPDFFGGGAGNSKYGIGNFK